MNPVVAVAVEVGLWSAAAVKLRHLLRSPEDLPLRAVTGLCCCLALGSMAQLPWIGPVIEDAATGASKLLLNLFTVTATYCLMAFYGFSVGGPAATVQLRNRLFGLLAVQVLMTAAWLSAPEQVRPSPGALSNLDDPHGAVFLVAALGYMAYGLSYAFRWSVLYARAADRIRVRASLSIVSAALGCLLLACLIKTTLALALGLLGGFDLDAPSALVATRSVTVLVLLGTLLIVTGFCYPAVASAPQRVRLNRDRRRLYRRLGPLWQRMRSAFPELVLTRGRLPWPGGGWLPWTYRAYYRRVIEIRDTIVQLAPYYDPEVARAASVGGPQPDGGSAQQPSDPQLRVLAALTADALRRRHEQRPVPAPYALPPIGGDDLDSDARWLARLAAELDNLPDQSSSVGPVSAVSSSTSSMRRT